MMFYIKAFRELRKLKSYYHGAEDEAILRLSEYVSYSKSGQLGNGQISD